MNKKEFDRVTSVQSEHEKRFLHYTSVLGMSSREAKRQMQKENRLAHK